MFKMIDSDFSKLEEHKITYQEFSDYGKSIYDYPASIRQKIINSNPLSTKLYFYLGSNFVHIILYIPGEPFYSVGCADAATFSKKAIKALYNDILKSKHDAAKLLFYMAATNSEVIIDDICNDKVMPETLCISFKTAAVYDAVETVLHDAYSDIKNILLDDNIYTLGLIVEETLSTIELSCNSKFILVTMPSDVASFIFYDEDISSKQLINGLMRISLEY